MSYLLYMFCPDAKLGTSLATKWNNWQSDFDMYLTASGITDPTRKRALLLYQAGSRVCEIFKQIPDTGTSADYDIAKDNDTDRLRKKVMRH